MKYKINELAKIASVSTRTLRYYDQIGILTPKRHKESNYRYYDTSDVDKLQIILFYKELDFKLVEIEKIINLNIEAKKELFAKQLSKLKKEMDRIEVLINNVQKTIKRIDGGITMTDNEKFAGLKKAIIDENDAIYKEEVIKKYGKEAYAKSKMAFQNMSEEEYSYFNALGQQIIELLLEAFNNGNDYKSITSQKAASAHQEWINIAWGRYDKEAHLGLVDMYLVDERFKKYYDAHQIGLTKLLRDAVYHFLGQAI